MVVRAVVDERYYGDYSMNILCIVIFLFALALASVGSFMFARNERLMGIVRRLLFIYRHRGGQWKVLADNPNAWYAGKLPILWAYAGGGHLHQYGNSVEAIDTSIAKSFKVIEIDVSLTEDGVPVVTHWFRPDNQVVFNKTPTIEVFKKTLINNKYHTMTLKELFDRYSGIDVYFSVDPAHIVALRQKFDLVQYIINNAPIKFQRRVIYQVYTLDELARISRISPPFASLHYVLEVLNNARREYWKIPYLIPYLTEAGVRSVSLRDREISNGFIETVKAFNNVNIRVSVTGVDYKDRCEELMKIGVSCFNTRLMEPAMFDNEAI